MFKLGRNRSLHLGKGVEKLNLVIMLPKQESRARGSDTTVKKVLESRAGDTEVAGMIAQRFTQRNSHRIRRLRLKVEVRDMRNNELLCSAMSGRISDVTSLRYGTLALYDCFPLVSCERGGEKGSDVDRVLFLTAGYSTSSII